MGWSEGQGLLGVWAVRAQAVSTSFSSSPLFLAGSHLTKGCCLAPAADARDLELALTSFAFPSHTRRPVHPSSLFFWDSFCFHSYQLVWTITPTVFVRLFGWLACVCVCSSIYSQMCASVHAHVCMFIWRPEPMLVILINPYLHLFCFWNRVLLCIPGWPQTHFIVKEYVIGYSHKYSHRL